MNYTHRKLHRSADDRILAGVCGGIAEYFDVDPVLVRIAFVIFSMGGMGIFAYIILALIIPSKEGSAHARVDTSEKADEFVEEAVEKIKGVRGRNMIGAVLIGFGLIALLHQLFPSVWFRWHMVWPLGLVLVGFWIIKSRD